jgi:hypothetical protein
VISRRSFGALALAVLVLGACGDDPTDETAGSSETTATALPSIESTTTLVAPPSVAPPSGPPTSAVPAPDLAECASPAAVPSLIVAAGTEVAAVDGEERRVLVTFDDEVWLAFGDADGLVVASTRVGTGPGSKSQGWIVEGGVAREIVEEGSPGVLVYELAHDGGEPIAIYGPLRDVSDDGFPESTPIVAARIDGSDRWGLGNAFAPEWAVVSASAASGLVAFTANSDLTETVFTTAVRDPRVLDERFAPKADYNMPPLVTSAVLAPDATELAWIEGPDWIGVDQAMNDAPWQLVVADAQSGEERYRRSVLTSDEAVLHIEWDGDTAIISRFDEPPMLVDTSDTAASLREACGVTGVATLPRPRR